jgi:hypothetical protein
MIGPDWTDVETMMRYVEDLLECRVSLTISPEGIGGAGGLIVALTIRRDVLPGSDLTPEVVEASRWPCGLCGSLPGHVWNGLWRLDWGSEARSAPGTSLRE